MKELNFDYNTTRPYLILSEYGRNVQNMVKYVVELEDRDERNRYAKAVIDLMGFLNPHLRDVADFKHKLWDHLYVISNYAIDVDCPYDTPSPEKRERKPVHLGYPQDRIRFKHYGKAVENFIKQAIEEEDAERKEVMVNNIANFMKMAYVTWNKDTVTDETIFKDLHELSGGRLSVNENVNLNKVEVKPAIQDKKEGKKHKQKKNFKRNNNQKQRY